MEPARRELSGLLLGAMLAALLLVGRPAAPARADDAPSPPAVLAVSPEEAVRAAVEADGDTYAGDCEQTVSPRDLGKVCSRLVAERAGTQAYLVGRTFGEFSRWVFVAPVAPEGWQVVGATPLDFFAPPDPPWPGEERAWGQQACAG